MNAATQPDAPTSTPAPDDFVARARDFATEAHARIDHRRKYTLQPYQEHLKAVAQMVMEVTDDPETIAAAWLHDTVEDTTATFGDIERAFGPAVAALVAELTDVSRPADGNRHVRKAIDLRHLAMASARAQTVKLADLTDNCRDICRHDPAFARVYVPEAAALLAVLGKGDPVLYQRAQKAVAAGAQRLGLPRPAQTVAGLRRDGLAIGYVRAGQLEDGVAGDQMRHYAPSQVLTGEATLSDVIGVLSRYDYCFVTAMGAVAGVVTRADIQKPVVRMWLFGIVTLLEMDLAARIRERWPDGGWTRVLSSGRLDKAQTLLEERRRRGQQPDLLDCLQLADKAAILMADPAQLAAFGFDTQGAAKRVLKELESLRNNLAHAQDIVTHDWPQIARLARRVEDTRDAPQIPVPEDKA